MSFFSDTVIDVDLIEKINITFKTDWLAWDSFVFIVLLCEITQNVGMYIKEKCKILKLCFFVEIFVAFFLSWSRLFFLSCFLGQDRVFFLLSLNLTFFLGRYYYFINSHLCFVTKWTRPLSFMKIRDFKVSKFCRISRCNIFISFNIYFLFY